MIRGVNTLEKTPAVPGAAGGPRGIAVPAGIAAAALLAPALAAWLAGWRWAPGDGGADRWVAAMVAVTDSAGFPLGIATSAVLAALFVLAARPARAHAIGGGRRGFNDNGVVSPGEGQSPVGFFSPQPSACARARAAIALVLLCAAAIGCAMAAKTLLKDTLREPRPFVKWLEARHSMPAGDFHALPRSARAEWLEAGLADDPRVPAVLRRHWMAETGYSFPSGHTAFAATWALLGVAVLWPRKRRAFCVALVAWAMLVEATRLALGMHWPRDIVAGVALGWLIAVCAAGFWRRGRGA